MSKVIYTCLGIAIPICSPYLIIGLVMFSCGEKKGIGWKAVVSEQIDYNFHVRPILSDKCFACHGPDANNREAGLRLDTEEGALTALEGYQDKYAIVKGKPHESMAFLRMTSLDSAEMMPPPRSNMRLSVKEIEIIKNWIEQGAEYKPHWAFVPPVKSKTPQVKNLDWVTNEIDYFILEKLEEIGLKPNKRADKERLLKRLSFDIVGLPPTMEMQKRFLNDQSDDAYEKLVDELLSSKHYGEKMAVHWLDIARYADSHGYQDDGLRTMWPWRDWVIHALNQNYPFDKFITWQLAGDLIPQGNAESLLATGFNRNHKITQEDGVIDEEYRIEYVTDRTNTLGKAFLGLTVECAKCHDHKYDPISQRDYYKMFAFFDKVPEKGRVGIIDHSFADPPNMKITDEMVNDILTFINKKSSSGDVEVMVMKDSVGIRTTHILERGNYDAKGEIVDFGTPKAILDFDTLKYPSNRLGLSQWLLSEGHPLTARVFVNRIWMEFFSRGIVRTIGDFGMQGGLPSHPQLLDWLAVDFRENGWDVKWLIKQMVMSSTYTQSSVTNKKKLEKDPENIYLSRMSRSRLNAEMIRDHVLASSGLLNDEIGGPSVKPYQPDGMWAAASSGRGSLQRYIQDMGADLYRRGIYTFIKRTVPPPVMLTFDSSPRDQCEVGRLSTNTPLQALVMLNDPTVLEAARVLAERLSEDHLNDEDMITRAFYLIICRSPKEEEKQILLRYLAEQRMNFEAQTNKAKEFLNVGEYPILQDRKDTEIAALMQVIHTIYNMEEAIVKG